MFGAPYDPDVSVKGLYAYLSHRTSREYATGGVVKPEYKGWPAAGRPERFVRVPSTT
jgi:hypothetical protein